ncbi:MAG: metallophosphoesterase family protein [Candidatus Omnitrophica bacterium]|nr:metallophosphoesterase family protein [Candidatus Omnitrophota bacterium]
MRYGIFSDIHSNLEALQAVLQAYQKESIDKYLCIGDVVGYAASPNECVSEVKKLAQVTIAGNHDWASVDLFPKDYFNPIAKEAVIWTKTNLSEASSGYLKSLKLFHEEDAFFLVHGSLNNPEDFNYMNDDYTAEQTFKILTKDLCFVGHTHFPGSFILDHNQKMAYLKSPTIEIKKGNKYIINVGSVGQPRDGNPASSYGIFDTKKKTFELKRVSYDVKETQKKIYAAGLPSFLAERLLAGR